MSHACVRRFDVTGTIESFLRTKHPEIYKICGLIKGVFGWGAEWDGAAPSFVWFADV